MDDQLLLRINHEIRSAVNATLGLTELLLESQLTREQNYRVNMIRLSIDLSVAKTEQVADLAEDLPGGCAVLLRDSVGGTRLFVRWTVLRSVRGGIGLQLLDLPL